MRWLLDFFLSRVPGTVGIRDGKGWSVGQIAYASLPTCDVTREAEERWSRGVAGVASRFVRCQKNASNVYAWVDLGAGSVFGPETAELVGDLPKLTLLSESDVDSEEGAIWFVRRAADGVSAAPEEAGVAEFSFFARDDLGDDVLGAAFTAGLTGLAVGGSAPMRINFFATDGMAFNASSGNVSFTADAGDFIAQANVGNVRFTPGTEVVQLSGLAGEADLDLSALTATRDFAFPDASGTLALTSGAYTDEQAQDAVGTILVDTASIDLTYNDATPSITAAAIFGTTATTVAQGNHSHDADYVNVSGDTMTGTLTASHTGNPLDATRFAASSAAPIIFLRKSRGAASPTNTVVQSGDSLGVIIFSGADGTGYIEGAIIAAQVDGTPGTNDMPTRLSFWTTPDGTSAAVDRGRIDSSGNWTMTSLAGTGTRAVSASSSGVLGATTPLDSLSDVAITSAATGDMLRKSSGDWVNVNPPSTVVTLFTPTVTAADNTWVNMPSAVTGFMGPSQSHAFYLDTSLAAEFRLCVQGTVAGVAGSELRLEYWTGSAFADAASSGGAGDVGISSGGLQLGSWSPFVAGAMGVSTFFRLVGLGGNAVVDPQFGLTIAEIR